MQYVKKHKIVFLTISTLLYILQHAVGQTFTLIELICLFF